MKTSNHSSTIGASLVINGTYVKIYKFDNLLLVLHARNVFGQPSASTGTTIVTFTNWDDTTIDISFSTQFLTGTGGIAFDEYVLPLQCKSFVLKTNAVAPPGGGNAPFDQVTN